ncbi:MAG: hypothetical protein V3581_03300 [Candidatus Cardinium sp.]|uniref:hypothetical protein n=1 Tax=Candidatus Cardinium sp. TP TaxID=2961955 RepID=UPI0021AF994A|nr:hypothetical protein [Candidatus Cardinium sp. TP]MCT4697218.1 hypothetical protein [Candidatus Cardinium sp. TP]MDN5247346.1 hypothetical protein [Candidatus Cardinium sp.]
MQGIFTLTFFLIKIDHISLIIDLLEKDYTSYANEAFLYMLKVDDHLNLLETIKKSNPRLNQIAMSVAEKLEKKGSS